MRRIINRAVIGATLLGLIGCVHWAPMKRDSDRVRVSPENQTIVKKSSLNYNGPCSVKVTRPLACPIEVNGSRYLLDLNMGDVRTGLVVDFTLQPTDEELHYTRPYLLNRGMSGEQKDKMANEGHL